MGGGWHQEAFAAKWTRCLSVDTHTYVNILLIKMT